MSRPPRGPLRPAPGRGGWVRALLLGLCALLAPHAAGEPEAPFAVERVAPGVYVHAGRTVDIDHPDRGDMANIAFVVGGRCVAVIDTGGARAVGEALRAAIAARTPLPVCYVINTHVHFDHLLGNVAFLDDAPQFVGHARLGEALVANRAFFLEQFAREMGPGASEADLPDPDITVDTVLELDLGGRRLLLQAHSPGHTRADLTVYDPATGTLFSGDVLFMERLPVFDASLRGWLGVMDTLQSLDAERVVPGHGPVTAPWPDALAAQRRYLEALLRDTRAALDEGLFVDEAMAGVARDEAAEWALSEHNHARNVSRAYRELEWE